MTINEYQLLAIGVKLEILFNLRFSNGQDDESFIQDLSKLNSISPRELSALLEVIGCRRISSLSAFVRHQLHHADPSVRYFACDALGWIGDVTDVPLLKSMMGDLSLAMPFGDTVAWAAQTSYNRLTSA